MIFPQTIFRKISLKHKVSHYHENDKKNQFLSTLAVVQKEGRVKN